MAGSDSGGREQFAKRPGRGPCEHEDWRNAKGELRLARGRQVLPELAARLGRALPLAQTQPVQVVPQEEIEVLFVDLRARRTRLGWQPTAPPDIRTFIIDLGRVVGLIPSKRQPLPGTKKVWRGHQRIKIGSYYLRAVRQNE